MAGKELLGHGRGHWPATALKSPFAIDIQHINARVLLTLAGVTSAATALTIECCENNVVKTAGLELEHF